jgi:peptidoglycan/LPS O-acetylase OafA/YrhL
MSFTPKTNIRQAIPEIVEPPKIEYLDGLRCISVLLVVLGHINTYYIKVEFLEKLLGSGGLGVTFFFVISGFLITTLFLKEESKSGSINIRKFYIRRVLRILPVAYLYVVVLVICNIIFKLQIPPSYFIAAALFVSSIGRFNQTSDPNGNSKLIAHYWSLSVEEQFYLFFPWVFRLFRRRLTFFLIIGIVVVNICRTISTHTYFFFHYESILIGAVMALLVFKNNIKYQNIKYGSFWLSLLFGSILIINYLGGTYTDLLVGVLFSIFLLGLIRSKAPPMMFRFLRNKIVIKIGVLSYSIYIWQQIFATNNGIKEKIPALNNLPLALLMIALVSWGSYTFYEKWFLQLKSKFI